jgi:endogenous inhibitor of DNA gyrase (YacG/DUF329 family)
MVRCPVCGKKFEPAESSAMPFCSDRCRLIDLGRWLNEENRLSALRPADEEPDVGD